MKVQASNLKTDGTSGHQGSNGSAKTLAIGIWHSRVAGLWTWSYER
jgi:hypothetical protein